SIAVCESLTFIGHDAASLRITYLIFPADLNILTIGHDGVAFYDATNVHPLVTERSRTAHVMPRRRSMLRRYERTPPGDRKIAHCARHATTVQYAAPLRTNTPWRPKDRALRTSCHNGVLFFLVTNEHPLLPERS